MSTTLRILVGLLRADPGSILVLGADPAASQRPHAAALLLAAADPNRTFDAIVAGEYELVASGATGSADGLLSCGFAVYKDQPFACQGFEPVVAGGVAG